MTTAEYGAAVGGKIEDTMTVRIPACEEHQGMFYMVVRIKRVCPVCGGARGEVCHDMLSYDGSRRLVVDGWRNPCGHVDGYGAVLKEARANGLNGVSR